MSTKDLVDYVSDDLFNYFDKLGEHEFLEECRNYWDDSYDEVVEEIKDYMKCDFKATGDRPVDKVSNGGIQDV